MDGFTPFSATLGGLLIGLASALLLLALGRVAGVSGILGAALGPGTGERAWRAAFLLGLPLGASLGGLLAAPLAVRVAGSPASLAVAGLLVGLGTQLGQGCTSGHGVCGLARGSRRSWVATALFMTTAALVASLGRHATGG